MHSTPKSFYYAFQGLHAALRDEPNLQIHVILGGLAIAFGAMLNLDVSEWLLLAFTIFYVITLELLNTVIEAVVDLVSPEKRGKAKIAKDVSAACVLLGAIMALVVGAMLFLPKIIELLQK